MKFIIIGFLTFLSCLANSKTLIVTDIDDTIKVAHVRDSVDLAWYAYVTTTPFRGMSELYHKILDENPGSEIIYVTNANQFLMFDSHTQFVANNNFPIGEIFFRTTDVNVHKYNTIKSYLESHDIDKLIMLGDNGERDIEFYSKIQNEFKNKMVIKTYIRILYGSPIDVLPLKSDQKGFISPLEILADLTANRFLSRSKYLDLANKLAMEMASERAADPYGPQYFPAWLNCKNMVFTKFLDHTSEVIEKAYQKMESLCQ
jgi:hypothetical protein